jgi:hypothetical protein
MACDRHRMRRYDYKTILRLRASSPIFWTVFDQLELIHVVSTIIHLMSKRKSCIRSAEFAASQGSPEAT